MIYLQCKVVKHLRLYVCTIVFKRFDNTAVQVLIGFSLKIKKNVSLSIYPRPSTRGMIKMVYTIFTVFNQTFVIITGKGKKKNCTSSYLECFTVAYGPLPLNPIYRSRIHIQFNTPN